MKQRINITLDNFLLEELDYMAKKRGVSRSTFIAWMVSESFMEFQRQGGVSEDYYEQQALEAWQAVITEC